MTEQEFDILYDKMNKQFRLIDCIIESYIEENVDAKYVEDQIELAESSLNLSKDLAEIFYKGALPDFINDDLITKETKIIKAKEFLNNKKNSL